MAVSEKCDVFSFGVLAFEILMGKHPGELIPHVQSFNNAPNINLHEILDSRLPPVEQQKLMKEVVLIANLSISCLQINPSSRPTMRSITDQMI